LQQSDFLQIFLFFLLPLQSNDIRDHLYQPVESWQEVHPAALLILVQDLYLLPLARTVLANSFELVLKREQSVDYDFLSSILLLLHDLPADRPEYLHQMHLINVWLGPGAITAQVVVEDQADDLHHVLWREEGGLGALRQIDVMDDLLDAERRAECKESVDKVLVITAIELVDAHLGTGLLCCGAERQECWHDQLAYFVDFQVE